MTKPVFIRKNNGPLQIVHDFRFTALNVRDDYSFLDTACHEEKLKYMKKRVDRLCEKGYGGIVLEPQGSSDFRLRSQGPCRLGTGESGLVLG